MEELQNLLQVWIIASTALSYCYFIASKFPPGIFRLLSVLPVSYLFFLLPFSLSSFHFTGTTAFFLVWLSNSKLLLFAFNQGPLCSPPPSNLFHFIALAPLPIKIKQKQSPSAVSKSRSPILFPIKSLILLLLFHSYNYRQFIHPNLILAFYCVHLYLELEIVLAVCAIPARAIGFELEPQFDEPYLATSLQDFWGRRWNLMVTSILRPTVYLPVRRLCGGLFGGRLGSSPAFLATFVVSGLMHELIYYYLTRVAPTWEVTWFFVLHGACVAAEVAVKKACRDKWRLPPAISGPLTLGFASLTCVWLFFPQLVRNKMDDKIIREYSLFVDFVESEFLHFVD